MNICAGAFIYKVVIRFLHVLQLLIVNLEKRWGGWRDLHFLSLKLRKDRNFLQYCHCTYA